MQGNEEFLAALAAFTQDPPKEIEYRIYYDLESGKILNYTNEDLPGVYILVDRETFARHRFDCLIKDEKILSYRNPIGKLVPSDTGVACHPGDVTVIVSLSEPKQHWKMHTYED